MFHLDQCQNSPKNHLYRTHHVRSSANRDGVEENDFDFWKQAHTDEDFGCYSPVTWETKTLRSNMKDDESSPLLPYNHHYSIPCPTPSREAIILQSRKDLMEMIEDIPESCYEISLKDFVDDQQSSQGVEEENDVQETSFDFHVEAQVRKQKRKTQKSYNTTRQISRTSSMESEIFLIKVFFPTFLGSKKKKKAPENRSIVSPRPSAGGPENHNDWSKIRKFFLNKKSGTSCSSGSSSGSTSSSSNGSSRRSVTCRSSGSNILTGCWFFCSKKSKSKRQRGLVM
ncbi:uncharacterized protein LOC103956457 isoform X2 [Pyrus x bretschneideri]|uniref:uncharacterized protein LOC103956457 isoform X2 n=1 Tax=Pyrus x bretschneideri TaxID=225117 RepID=UPI0008707091|nr:uncharacterized protein LOC103956457 isoform X2 [Pyrus x bretschneideri]